MGGNKKQSKAKKLKAEESRRNQENIRKKVARLDAAFVAVALMIVLANAAGMLGLWQGFKGSVFGLIAGLVLLIWSMIGVVNMRHSKQK